MNINPPFLLISAVIFIILFCSALVSVKESEPKAAKRFFLSSFILPLPFLVFSFLEFSYKYESGIAILAVILLFVIIIIIPFGRNRKYIQTVPAKRIDERNTMFSRNELKPDTERYNEYYGRNPDKKSIDEKWRKKHGLLNIAATQYHPFHFASAKASLETIKALRNVVNGEVADLKIETYPGETTRYIKKWSKKLGAADCGVCELMDYHVYSMGGRVERYGKEFTKKHKYAIAVTVEMDHKMLATAPNGPTVMESAQQYMEVGKIAVQVAMFIRNLGYEARAHIDGNYEVVCPLIARDAGLGEIGRMGLLMTPRYGPRVRIAVVTTNLPMITDKPLNDYSMIDFCIKCKKCADTCPGDAIMLGDMEEIDGIKRWQINQEACFAIWCIFGTDCGRCMSVCPFSHPDNLLHNVVRAGIRNSSLFRKLALKLDDAIYGRKPESAKVPKWMRLDWKKKT